MEFYEKTLEIETKKAGFNSQRDGILLKKKTQAFNPCGFQFPTGWNSTIRASYDIGKRIVSIPNGMEFYLVEGISGSAVEKVSIPNGMEFYENHFVEASSDMGFNSQRDGILRDVYRCHEWTKKTFQFPTGWNSTKNQRLFFDICIGFNSQRDGILQDYTLGFKIRNRTFQFPTGWNSTKN